MCHLIDLSELPGVAAERCPHRHRPQWCPTCVAEALGPHPDVKRTRRPGERAPSAPGPTGKQRELADRLARELGHADAGSAAALDGWCPRDRREWSDLIARLLAEVAEARRSVASASDRLAASARGLPPGCHD